jgi:hypothetical protein
MKEIRNFTKGGKRSKDSNSEILINTYNMIENYKTNIR